MSCHTIGQFKKRLYGRPVEIAEVSQCETVAHIFSTFPDHLERDWCSVTGNCIFMQPDYLRAMESTQSAKFRVRLLMVYKHGKPALTALFHITGFIANELKSNLHGRSRFIRTLASAIRSSELLEKRRILICGSAFSTGEHGFFRTADISDQELSFIVRKAVDQIIGEEEVGGVKISAVLMKDFFPRSKTILKSFEKFGYKSFQVDHNMVMPVLSEWNSFDDYLMSMNSKFRTKAKAALSRSSSLVVRDLNVVEIAQNVDKLSVLFDQVVGNADFSLGKMDVSGLPELKRTMGDLFVCRIFEKDGEIVGFLTALMDKTCLEAYVVGINYQLNKNLAIYNRMLLEYVRLAIENKKTMIFFSRTASEIKSTVGAYPIEMTCLIKHPGRIGNFFLNVLFSYVKASPAEQRKPYLVNTEQKIETKLEVFY